MINDQIRLLNLRNMYDGHGEALVDGDILVWDSTRRQYLPQPLKTVSGSSLLLGGNLPAGSAGAIPVADYATPTGPASGPTSSAGDNVLNSTVLVLEAGLYRVDGAGIWTLLYDAPQLVHRYVFVRRGTQPFYYCADGLTFTAFDFQNGLSLKTLNGVSLLGSGDIVVSGSSYSAQGPLVQLTLNQDITSAGQMVYRASAVTPTRVVTATTAGSSANPLGMLLESGMENQARWVALKGSVVKVSTDLLPGYGYYVQPNGTFSIAYTTVPLGRAMTKRHLLLSFLAY